MLHVHVAATCAHKASYSVCMVLVTVVASYQALSAQHYNLNSFKEKPCGKAWVQGYDIRE